MWQLHLACGSSFGHGIWAVQCCPGLQCLCGANLYISPFFFPNFSSASTDLCKHVQICVELTHTLRYKRVWNGLPTGPKIQGLEWFFDQFRPWPGIT